MAPLDARFAPRSSSNAAGHADDTGRAGKYADVPRAPYDFAVQPLQRLHAVWLGAMAARQVYTGKPFTLSSVRQAAKLREACHELLNNESPLIMSGSNQVRRENGVGECRDPLPLAVGCMCQTVVREVYAASVVWLFGSRVRHIIRIRSHAERVVAHLTQKSGTGPAVGPSESKAFRNGFLRPLLHLPW